MTLTLITPRMSPRREPPPAPLDDSLLAYQFLQAGFSMMSVTAGADKFFDSMTTWERYLSPFASALVHGREAALTHAAGALEIAAGVLIALRPRLGAALLSCWLGLSVANLLMSPGHAGAALREAGLLAGSLALWRLSARFAR